MVTAADLQALSEATLRLYTPALAPENYPAHAFRFLSALIGADQINYANLDPQAGTMAMATSFMTPDWAAGVAGFGRCMWRYPMTNFDPGVNDGVPFFSTDFLSVRQFRDLDIYSECFRLLGMTHHGAVHVPTGDGHRLWFGLERAGRTAFSERDRLMLTLAQPHLANALQLARARQALRTERVPDPAAFRRAGYSSREAEVAHWLTEGKSNVEIAQILRLHVQTVKSHVTRLFNRTGCGNRLALTLHLLEVARRAPAENPPLHRVPAQLDPPG